MAPIVRSFELFKDLPKPTSDFVELAAIHRHLFQDVYSWAGTFRNVYIRKNVNNADAFAPHQRIYLNIQHAEEQLRADAYIQDLGRLEFTRRIAHHYDQFNFIHPFREGNGRAQRMSWLLVSRRAGWDLDWRNATGQRNDQACRIASTSGNLSPLKKMFNHVVVKPDDETQSIELSVYRMGIKKEPTETD